MHILFDKMNLFHIGDELWNCVNYVYMQYEHAIRYYNPQYYNSKYLLFTLYESIIFLMGFSVNPGNHSFVVNRSSCDDGQRSRAFLDTL